MIAKPRAHDTGSSHILGVTCWAMRGGGHKTHGRLISIKPQIMSGHRLKIIVMNYIVIKLTNDIVILGHLPGAT